MIVYAILGFAVAGGLYLILRGAANSNVKVLSVLLKAVLAIAGCLLLLYLAVTGKLAAALGAISVLGPLFLQWRAQRNREKAAHGPSPGKRSQITTRHLRMELDHDSGSLDGEILDGPLSGKWLSQLSRDDHLYVLDACRVDDPEGERVMEAFLDRRHGAQWRQQQGSGRSSGGGGSARDSGDGPMSADEAYAILGLRPGATADAIREAHRNLIRKLHPDLGGTDWLAARINQAKETLLSG